MKDIPGDTHVSRYIGGNGYARHIKDHDIEVHNADVLSRQLGFQPVNDPRTVVVFRRAEELRDPIKKMLEVKFGKVSYGKCWYKTSRKSRAVLQRPALYIG